VTVARNGQGRRQRFEQSVPAALTWHKVEGAPVRRRPAWLMGGVGLAAIALALGLWVALSPLFYVTDVQVVGAERIPAETILAASGLSRLHILWADAGKAQVQIRAQLPSVEWVRVSCGLPARCTIAVVERPALLTWEANGALFWVDAAGGVFPAAAPLTGRWLVSGPLPTDGQGLVEQEVLVGLAELTQLGIQPGRISYRTGRGLVLDDPAGWRVVLGQGTGMKERLQVYAVVHAHLLAHGIHPLFVDVRFPEAPYYSEENEW
jgi:cell division septal protein FtsQ